jgi:hypothetical protein
MVERHQADGRNASRPDFSRVLADVKAATAKKKGHCPDPSYAAPQQEETATPPPRLSLTASSGSDERKGRGGEGGDGGGF